MPKCHRTHDLSVPLLSVGPDILSCILNALGLHGVNLRATCKELAALPLPSGVALALKVLQAGPSLPIAKHAPRRTTLVCTHNKWDYFTYRSSLVWRLEWALVLKHVDLAPIHVLLDAYDAIPPDKDTNLVGPQWIGTDEITQAYQSWYLRLPDHGLDDHGFDDVGYASPFRVRGSFYTSHVRLALFKAIEARMWELIWGEDLERTMHEEEVVDVVRRIFNTTPVRNGRCFFFTNKGWLKYTPFLLAAERHNLPLVRYLAGRGDTDTGDRSTMGNNAYAICKNSLRYCQLPELEIANSPVLAYLTNECRLAKEVYREEGRH